jgi:hypothetical protein
MKTNKMGMNEFYAEKAAVSILDKPGDFTQNRLYV